MREIKFRAWDVFNQKMFSPRQLANLAIAHNVPDWAELGTSTVVLMQYTGKDKNGKECYWDDIVDDGVNPPFVITPDYHLLARLSEIEFKVIGNIHENKELLEAEDA